VQGVDKSRPERGRVPAGKEKYRQDEMFLREVEFYFYVLAIIGIALHLRNGDLTPASCRGELNIPEIRV
jgi:hypothetical protein